MRKKYLSALLFGALLFASAGTFTSCKDYDDDINNLQEQINTINTTLTELKSQIGDKGVSSVTFDEATGVLTVVDADGTHAYTIKTTAGEVADVEITLDGQELKVNGETIGKVGDTVTVVEGELTVNGEGTGIMVGQYAILLNEADGTYTIQLPDADGKMQTITLLKAIPTNLQIVLDDAAGANLFTQNDANTAASTSAVAGFTPVTAEGNSNGIFWSTAAAADWDGPKGKVEAGQLLVGQIRKVQVSVLPTTVELDKQALKLVDSEGNEAPVVVNAIPVNGSTVATSGSRSKDAKGEWYLAISMKADVTKDNIAKIFTYNDDNKAYALSVNGSVQTPFEFVIDTKQASEMVAEKTNLTNLTYSPSKVVVGGVPVGKFNSLSVSGSTTPISDAYTPAKGSGTLEAVSFDLNKAIELTYVDPMVYDYKFEIAKEDIADAKTYGITLENNVITAGDKAANKSIRVVCSIIGVNGAVSESTDQTLAGDKVIVINFVGTTVEATDVKGGEFTVPATTLATSTTAADCKFITLDLGDTFSGLTDAQAVSLESAAWAIDKDIRDEFLLKTNADGTLNLTDAVTFYSDEACEEEVSFNDEVDHIQAIRYARIPLTSNNVDTSGKEETAKPGTYKLTLTLSSSTGEVKKVNVPVIVSLPKFSDVFVQSGAWDKSKNTASLVITSDGILDMLDAYSLAKDMSNASTGAIVGDGFTVTVNPIDDTKAITTASSNKATITAGLNNAQVMTVTKVGTSKDSKFKIEEVAIKDGKLRALTAETSYKVQGFENFEIKSGEYTIQPITVLEGAKIVYLEEGAETELTTITGNTYDIIANDKVASAVADKATGLVIKLDGKYYALDDADAIDGVTMPAGSDDFKKNDGTDGQISFTGEASENGNVTYGSGTPNTLTISVPKAGDTANGYTTNMILTVDAVTVGSVVVEEELPLIIKVVRE